MLIYPNERVGLILKDGSLVELTNISNAPQEAFEVAAADMLKYEDTAAATWHTHTKGDANLSAEDYVTFLAWPVLLHVIAYGQDVRGFYVDQGALIHDDGKDHPAWDVVRNLAERLSV